uniref:Uncharacterized protein n=1 Tax=Tanacetum cinerariifolium TaxID=118510 RepID=A0A699H0Z9_TANCI|nr:hypothetical protein [Tanacetum cinerariifolium]
MIAKNVVWVGHMNNIARFCHGIPEASNNHDTQLGRRLVVVYRKKEKFGYSSYALEIRKQQHSVYDDLLKEYTNQKHQTVNG